MGKIIQGETDKMQIKKRKDKMKIDIKTNDCLYVEITDKIFYIDDSTNEAIMSNWDKSEDKIVRGE